MKGKNYMKLLFILLLICLHKIKISYIGVLIQNDADFLLELNITKCDFKKTLKETVDKICMTSLEYVMRIFKITGKGSNS